MGSVGRRLADCVGIMSITFAIHRPGSQIELFCFTILLDDGVRFVCTVDVI